MWKRISRGINHLAPRIPHFSMPPQTSTAAPHVAMLGWSVRVLFVSDDYPDARVGAVQATRQLARALRARGCECRLLFHYQLGTWPRRERLRLWLAPWLAWRAVVRVWRQYGPFDVIDAAGAEGFV